MRSTLFPSTCNLADRKVTPMKRAYTIEEFSERYGPKRTLIYQMMKDGRLNSVLIGSKRLIRHDDAEAWLASLTESKNAV